MTPTEDVVTTSITNFQDTNSEAKVYEAIKARCIEECPDNYRMQGYCIDEDTKAFRDVHGRQSSFNGLLGRR